MQVKVETKTTQIIDEKQEIIQQIGKGNIENYEKGTILLWEVIEENLHFQMTILENKILLKKQNQTITFELGRTTLSPIQTQYGNLDMKITTKHMEIQKEKEQIQTIKLEYDIEIEDVMKYQNKIEINIK